MNTNKSTQPNLNHLLIKQKLLMEASGINDDVITLSDFLFNDLKNSNLAIGENIIYDDLDLPILKSVNIIELVVVIVAYENYVRGEFSLDHSTETENNNYKILIRISEITQETIYHEINHVLQFILKGKESSLKQEYYNKSYQTASRVINQPPFKYFIDLIYFSQEGEINSLVAETYPLIKNIKSKRDAVNTVKRSNAHQVAKSLINYNIFEEFKDLDEYDVGVFFELIKTINRSTMEKFDKDVFIEKIVPIIQDIYKGNLDAPYVEVTENRMKNNQRKINLQGEKLRRKLFRLLSLIELNQENEQ